MAEESAMDNQPASMMPAPMPDRPSEPVNIQEPYLPQPSIDSPAPPLMNIHADIDMVDAAPSPAALPINSTPTVQRTATPTRNTNGNVEVSVPLPTKAAIHGAPARVYLNEKVTGVLLEGMKKVALDQPEDPLRVLGEFLLQRSKDIEGT